MSSRVAFNFFRLVFSGMLFMCFSSSLLAAIDSGARTSFIYFLSGINERTIDEKDAQEFVDLLKDEFSGSSLDSLQITRTEDLVNYISFLDSRIKFVEKNSGMLALFIESSLSLDRKTDAQFQSFLIDERNIFASYNSKDFIDDIAKGTTLEFYQSLKKFELFLIERLGKLQSVNDGLRALKMVSLKEARESGRKRAVEDYRQQLSGMKEIVEKKETTIVSQDKEIQDLKHQFDGVQLGLEVFRGRLQEANQKMDNLVEEVATRSLDLFQKERESVDSKQQVFYLESELTETNERLRLVHRIILEKDGHIQSLEEEIIGIQIQMNNVPVTDANVMELRDEMNLIVDELRTNIKQDQVKIRRLELRFQEVVLANAQFKSELITSNLISSILEKQVKQKDDMIADLEQNYYVKLKKMSEMKGVVKIYQLKLQDYKGLLREKDLELQGYRDRISLRDVEDDYLRPSFVDENLNEQMLALDFPDFNSWDSTGIKEYYKEVLKDFKFHNGEIIDE